MKILSTKRFEFVGDDKKTFVTAGNMVIETAPDWIQKCELFGLAVSDGAISVLQDTVISGSSGTAKMSKAEKAAAAKAAADEAAKLAEEAKKAADSEEAAKLEAAAKKAAEDAANAKK